MSRDLCVGNKIQRREDTPILEITDCAQRKGQTFYKLETDDKVLSGYLAAEFVENNYQIVETSNENGKTGARS